MEHKNFQWNKPNNNNIINSTTNINNTEPSNKSDWYIVIPYVVGLCEIMKNICGKFGIQNIFQRQLYTHKVYRGHHLLHHHIILHHDVISITLCYVEGVMVGWLPLRFCRGKKLVTFSLLMLAIAELWEVSIMSSFCDPRATGR